jgi:hypothetical protein
MMALGYQHYEFEEMKNLLSGNDKDPQKNKVPEVLNIKIINPILHADNAKNFSLGTNQYITGGWKFYTKLSLTENTIIKYVKEWDNWGSKDLDGLTVEDATLTFNVKKDVALNAEHIKFTLLGKTGELIGEAALMGDEEQPIEIKMKGNPVKNIYGGKVEVTLKGQNRDISKEQQIEISNLRVKIDGYYDKEF